MSVDTLQLLRRLLHDAFGAGFTAHDWDHALGGTHVLIESDGRPVSHASVVRRRLRVGDHLVDGGYVEAVATDPDAQRRGHATQVMAEVGRVIAQRHELGALSTGIPGFYARLGWEVWEGPTFLETASGFRRTADDDGGVMVLRPDPTQPLDRRLPLACDWREGDVW